jgi:GNAT superfamily N-acetyltransferase
MTSDVQIKRFEIADREALLSFLRMAYPGELRKSEPGFWTWHFLENPYTAADKVPLWVVKSGEQIVGQLATIPVRLKCGAGERPAIWILDFIVHADHRGKGLGKRLVRAAGESYPTMITLGINEQSTAVFRSLEWAAVGGVHRYHKLLFPGNAYDEIARSGPARGLVNLVYAPFRARVSRRCRQESTFVRPVLSFDDSFEDLWRRAAPQWNCAVVRDPKFLDWQFKKQPGKRFEVLGAYDGDRLVGYVVLFFRKPRYGNTPAKAAITDIVYDNASSLDVIGELLAAALRMALERRAGSLVTDVLDERIEKRLVDLGFWKIRSSPQFMASTNEDKDLVFDAANWFLTRADSDVSIFEDPNL